MNQIPFPRNDGFCYFEDNLRVREFYNLLLALPYFHMLLKLNCLLPHLKSTLLFYVLC